MDELRRISRYECAPAVLKQRRLRAYWEFHNRSNPQNDLRGPRGRRRVSIPIADEPGEGALRAAPLVVESKPVFDSDATPCRDAALPLMNRTEPVFINSLPGFKCCICGHPKRFFNTSLACDVCGALGRFYREAWTA